MEEHHRTSEGQFLTLAKFEGPVTHKHWRRPQGPRVEVESTEAARAHLLNILKAADLLYIHTGDI